MVDKDVVYGKIRNIQNCLRRIEEDTQGDIKKLKDYRIQDAFVLNVQRAIQSAIDMAAHIIADEGWGLVNELRDNFEILQRNSVIALDLSERLQNMVHFRNISVHEYTKLDLAIMELVLEKRLVDLEDFYSAVVKFFGFVRPV